MLQELITAFEHLGLLKAQFTRQLLHLRHEQIHQLVGVAIENLTYFTDVLAVLFGRDQSLATALATVDVVLQAQTMLTRLHCFT